MMNEDVAAPDLGEEIGRRGGWGKARVCDREPGVELQVGPVDPDELLEIDKGNQTLAQVDLAVGDTEPAPQMLDSMRFDLQPATRRQTMLLEAAPAAPPARPPRADRPPRRRPRSPRLG